MIFSSCNQENITPANPPTGRQYITLKGNYRRGTEPIWDHLVNQLKNKTRKLTANFSRRWKTQIAVVLEKRFLTLFLKATKDVDGYLHHTAHSTEKSYYLQIPISDSF